MLTVFVPVHRCGAVLDSHQVPSCDTHRQTGVYLSKRLPMGLRGGCQWRKWVGLAPAPWQPENPSATVPMTEQKPRLCLVVTVPLTLASTLAGQPTALSERFDVSAVCGPGDPANLARFKAQDGMVPFEVPLTRQITPATDLKALAMLVRHLRKTRPDIVQTYTPKAGLIGMMAARIARVPIRVHGVVGMPLMEANGRRATILNATERITYANATHLTCNSYRLRDWMHEHLTQRPIEVVGEGSINGVDVDKFNDTDTDAEKATRRAELGIAPDDRVFLFVGRVVRDKGIEELVTAFTRIAAEHDDVKLILVGDYEPHLDPVSPVVDDAIRHHPGIVKTGFVSDVRPYMALSDVFVLPSYREGLPNSLIEAGSMGLPSIATDINGCNEVIVPGENGTLVPAKNMSALENAMREMLDDETRVGLAERSRPSIVQRFSQSVFWPELLTVYEKLLAARPG